MNERQGGTCTACCTALAVVELEKPHHTPCRHLCAGGCAIHAQPEMPQTCREFQCEWLRGNVPEEFRPDRLGVIFWFGGPVPAADGSTLQNVLRVSEVTRGALAERRT